jgi:hypothetical protein
MMKSKKITRLFTLFFLFVAFSLSSQTITQDWRSTLDLTGEELNKDVKIEVLESSSKIMVRVQGIISGGVLKVALYDPKGNKECSIQLSADKGGKARGTLEEEMDATPGTWKLKIENDEAEGKVTINVQQK